MRALKIAGAVVVLVGAGVVAMRYSPFSFGSAVFHTDTHGSSEFRRGAGGTGGQRPIRFSVEGDPELVGRVTHALATRQGFLAGGAAALRPGEALAKIEVRAKSRLITPVYAHSQVHLHAVLGSDGRLVETGSKVMRLTHSLWSYPVVRGEYDLDAEGKGKGLVWASGYFDVMADQLANQVATQLRTALTGDGASVAN